MRVGKVKEVGKYPWSSHRDYLEKVGEERIGLVDTEQVLGMFSEEKGRARRAYRVYMGEKEAIRREEVYATVDQRVLGDEQFVERVKERAGRRGLWGRRRHEFTLAEIAGAVERVYGRRLRQSREKGKGEVIQRGRRVMSLVGREYGYKGREIAEYLRKDPSVVTRYLREGKRFESGMRKVHESLKKQSQ
jgi:hypothetical protein